MEEKKPIDVPASIGPYKIIKALGSGGMGEVFLAHDPICNRYIAVKRMLKELEENPKNREQFLNEARLTGQMCHPAIVPILSIVEEKDLVFYTMPYIEGVTLKEFLSTACGREREGLHPQDEATVSNLMHQFLEICYAVAYAHKKGMIHRDLKPSNIMIGLDNQVVILDWGLVKYEWKQQSGETRIQFQEGEIQKVAGTLIYAAPELVAGESASFQSEIYSLGLILYQMLTLRYPFHRSSLEAYRQNIDKEVLVDPARAAPHRSISPILSQITLKCLSTCKVDRYQTVHELLYDLENYIKNHSHWYKIPKILESLEHFEIEKNLPKCIEMPMGSEIKIESTIRINLESSGIGFLLAHSKEMKESADHSYFLWIAAEKNKPTFLNKCNRRVIHSDKIFLTSIKSQQIVIEKVEECLNFYLDGILQFTHIDYLPKNTPYLSLTYDQNTTQLEDLNISILGTSFQPNPLAAANAYLESKNYSAALSEYLHIAEVFPYHLTGFKAFFLAGITLLEESLHANHASIQQDKRQQAFEVFSRLHGTAGALLEYLGKSIYYYFLDKTEEEVEFLERGLNRFSHQMFYPLLKRQIIFRLQSIPYDERKPCYLFALLAARYLPQCEFTPLLISSLGEIRRQWEPLYFIDDAAVSCWTGREQDLDFSSRLCFWLSKPHAMVQLIDEVLLQNPTPLPVFANALFALIEMGEWELVQDKLDALFQNLLDIQAIAYLDWIHEAIIPHQTGLYNLSASFLNSLPKKLEIQQMRTVLHIFKEALHLKQTEWIYCHQMQLRTHILSSEQYEHLDCAVIWASLIDCDWSRAKEILDRYTFEQSYTQSSLFFLYGCWLCAADGKDAAFKHFSTIQKVKYPHSNLIFCQLGPHQSEREAWLEEAFKWEKRQFYAQSALFHHCAGEAALANKYRLLEDSLLKHASSIPTEL